MADPELTTESTVYVTYIATTPERVWAALTSGEFTTRYFFGRSVESDWQEGSPWLLRRPDGTGAGGGGAGKGDPPRRLVVSWKVDGTPEWKNLPESVVTYEIEAAGEGVV